MKALVLLAVFGLSFAVTTAAVALDCDTDTECENAWRTAYAAKHHS